MAAYIVAHVTITNSEAYREYMRHTPRAIAAYGGKFIARGGEMVTLEGEPEKQRLVLMEFPDLDSAKAFYHSSEYVNIKKLRKGAGEARFVAIDGYPLERWMADAETSSKLTTPT